MKQQRRKVWINRFQTHLVWRLSAYFILYQLATWAMVGFYWLCIETIRPILGPAHGAIMYLLPVACLVVLGLVFVIDSVKLAHRLVGPIYRFQKVFQAIRLGEEVDLVTLRRTDFLTEMKDEINHLLILLAERGVVTLKGTDRSPARPREETVTLVDRQATGGELVVNS